MLPKKARTGFCPDDQPASSSYLATVFSDRAFFTAKAGQKLDDWMSVPAPLTTVGCNLLLAYSFIQNL